MQAKVERISEPTFRLSLGGQNLGEYRKSDNWRGIQRWALVDDCDDAEGEFFTSEHNDDPLSVAFAFHAGEDGSSVDVFLARGACAERVELAKQQAYEALKITPLENKGGSK